MSRGRRAFRIRPSAWSENATRLLPERRRRLRERRDHPCEPAALQQLATLAAAAWAFETACSLCHNSMYPRQAPPGWTVIVRPGPILPPPGSLSTWAAAGCKRLLAGGFNGTEETVRKPTDSASASPDGLRRTHARRSTGETAETVRPLCSPTRRRVEDAHGIRRSPASPAARPTRTSRCPQHQCRNRGGEMDLRSVFQCSASESRA